VDDAMLFAESAYYTVCVPARPCNVWFATSTILLVMKLRGGSHFVIAG
jgi:hypothetical protein